MAKVKRVRRELGRTESVLRDKTPEAEGEPVEQHPGVSAAISPRGRANTGNHPKVGRRNVTNEVTLQALRES